MTWPQIRKLFSPDRTKEGEIIVQYEDELADDPEQLARRGWLTQGYTHAECDLLWQEHLEIGYADQVCHSKGLPPNETARQIAAFKDKLRRDRRAKGFLVRS